MNECIQKDPDESEVVLVQALNDYKKKYFKSRDCDDCGTREGVLMDDQSCNDYCWSCLEKYLRSEPAALFDAISHSEPEY